MLTSPAPFIATGRATPASPLPLRQEPSFRIGKKGSRCFLVSEKMP